MLFEEGAARERSHHGSENAAGAPAVAGRPGRNIRAPDDGGGRPGVKPEPGAVGLTVSRSHVREGCDVYGVDAEWVGGIKEVRIDDFLVARPLRRDVYVPIAAIGTIVDSGIVLAVRADEVGERGWPRPPLVGRAPA
jgi:hypothetical protein